MQSPTHPPVACNAQTIVDILRQRAEKQPTTVAYRLRYGDEQCTVPMTYGALDRKARAIGAWLQQRQATGQRVLLLYPFGLDFIAGFYGCLYAGAIAVPLYPPRQNRLDQRLLAVAADAQPAFAFTTAKILASLAERQGIPAANQSMAWLATDTIGDEESAAWQEVDLEPETLAFLQYTSGSTGTPKGVMVSHANLLHNSELIRTAFAISPQSTGLMWTPFYHDMGLIGGVVQPIYAGIPTTLMAPIDFLQQPQRWLQAISAERVSISGGPNFAYELCLDKISPEQCAGLDLACWEVAFSGAEPVRAHTLERFAAKFAPYGFRWNAFMPCLGMAESTLFVSSTPKAQAPTIITCDAEALAHHRITVTDSTSVVTPTPATQRLVSSGRAWLDQTVRIVHPERQTPCGDNEVGEIWIAGPSVARGYWNRPAETAQTFGATVPETGTGPFLRSGDLGFTHQGELFVTGRLKDLIIIRGKNYYPQDIELTVERAHPALRAGCTAAFSMEAENEEKLVIVQEVARTHLRKLPTDDVVTAIRRAIAQEHQLQVYSLVLLRPGHVLKTSSGKIQRCANRQAYLQGELEALHIWQLYADQLPAAREAVGRTTERLPNANGRVPNAQPATIEGWLIAQLAHKLRVAPAAIDLNKPFADYGLDSLAAVDLVQALGDWSQSTGHPVELEVTALWDFPTIADLARHLAAKQTAAQTIVPEERLWPGRAVRPMSRQRLYPEATVVRPAPTGDLTALQMELAKLEQLLSQA